MLDQIIDLYYTLDMMGVQLDYNSYAIGIIAQLSNKAIFLNKSS